MKNRRADQDLNAQQQHLSSIQYDLRITNLARFIYKQILSAYPLRATRYSLIDIGAGNGLFLKFFKQKGFTVAGVELEKENVENMKKDPQLKGADIRQGDITQLAGKSHYDVVIASDVIEHIENDVTAIRNLWSFVKPGGLLIITVPAHSFLYGKRDEKWGHFRRYDKCVLLERIESAVNTTPSDVTSETPPYKGGELKNKKALLLTKEEYPDGNRGEVVFATFWNIIGFFVYGLFEKILHKPINEEMRYSNSLKSCIVRGILDRILKIEELCGGVPLGLTLVVGVQKVR